MKKAMIIILLIMMISTLLYAEGEYGIFSDICLNGISKGSGEVEYIGNDINWNMGYLGLYKGKEINILYRGMDSGINTSYISYYMEIPKIKGGIGIGVPYIGKIISVYYNENGDSIGTYGYYEVEPQLYYGYRVNEKIGIGIKIGALITSINSENAIYPLFGMGMVYKDNNGFTGGISINDIGMKINDDYGEVESAYRAGVGIGYEIKDVGVGNIKIGINGGYINKDIYYSGIGIEYGIKEMFYIRSGYVYRSDYTDKIEGIRFGIGFNKNRIRFNYGMEYRDNLGLINVVSLGILI